MVFRGDPHFNGKKKTILAFQAHEAEALKPQLSPSGHRTQQQQQHYYWTQDARHKINLTQDQLDQAKVSTCYPKGFEDLGFIPTPLVVVV